jgi:peptide/nickel transport system substrate-binding protein
MKATLIATALTVAAALSLSACGGGSTSSTASTITIGTTDVVSSIDPAKGYGSGDQAVMNALYQGVMYTPPGQSDPVPQLAESCSFKDPVTYVCTIKSGQKFSNGDALTAKDVAFSLNRAHTINDPVGGAFLLESFDNAEAPSDTEVIFHLKRPNAAWPKILAGPIALIVPSKVFNPTQLMANADVIGSGPYKLNKFTAGEIASLVPNAEYTGTKPKNTGIIFRYYQTPSSLRLAFQNKDVDVAIAWRSLTTGDVEALGKGPGVQTLQLPGLDTRYLAFNTAKPPVDNKAVRQAVAQLVNRDALAKQVLGGGVEPLYAIAPAGITGAETQPFKSVYDAPNPGAAKKLLDDAGVKTPVPLVLWYTPSHYGGTSGDEATEISRQLNASGLFNVTLQSSEWDQYNSAANDGSYEIYEAGWYPDYADPDNFLTGLLAGGWTTNYNDPEIKKWLADEQASTDQAARTKLFADIEQRVATDVPVIPLYQANYTMLAQDGVTGIKESANVLFTLDYAQWSKDESA